MAAGAVPGGTAPVVVIGAGPVGLTAAILLGRRGVETLLLERHPAPYPLPRAVHVDGEVLRILQEAGIADAFRAVSRPMPGLRLVDARLRTLAEFRRERLVGESGHPEASMFDQPDLERLLLDRLAGLGTVTLRRGCTVTGVEPRPGGAVVRWTDAAGAGREVRAAAVLGCDGAGSTVRGAIGSVPRDLRFAEPWLVVDVRSPRPLDVWDGVQQVCDPARAATFMPVTGDRYRWEFRLAPGESSGDLATPERLAALLAPWTGDVPFAELELIRVATYTFRARMAETWRSGRVFLLGDAAHETPPFVGQGLGAGLRDAHNLAWKLDLVLRGAAPERLLDTYQAERRPHAIRTVRIAIAAGWALSGGQDRAAWARRVLMAAVCRLPGVSPAVLRAYSPPLPRGPLVRASRWLPSPVGRPLPQAALPAGWFDDVLGDSFALVTAGHAADAAGTLPGLRVVRVDRAGPYAAVTSWLERRRLHAALVRPDRVVLATARTAADVGSMVRAAAAPLTGRTVPARSGAAR